MFSRGCLIHACGHAESAIAIDLVNQTIHVGIYRGEESLDRQLSSSSYFQMSLTRQA